MVETRRMKDMFNDIGLDWGLDKCATVNVKRGKIVLSENLPLSKKDSINALETKVYYKFLGKAENFQHLDELIFERVSGEYLKRMNVIWSSNISIPRKIKATNTFALPVIQYNMWTAEWRINDLKQLDRETRKTIQEHGGMHYSASTKLLYLPAQQGGHGLAEIESIYKTTKIKVANYLMRNEDPRLQLVRRFEEIKITKGLRPVFKDATKYANDLGIDIALNEAETILSSGIDNTIKVQSASPKLISKFLGEVRQSAYKTAFFEQNWLGAFSSIQHQDKETADDAHYLLQKWKNIPDIVYTVNTSIRQQLLPTKSYIMSKLQQHVEDLKCGMCTQKQETATHIMCACPRIAQSLYKSRHDKMLRPYYHYLLSKYAFQDNDHNRPWYQQSLPTPVVENENAKIMWDIAFHLSKAPENNANRIDMAIQDKQNKKWILIEGTVCGIGQIQDRSLLKQNKYRELRAGIQQQYPEFKIQQINVVFDFLSAYHQSLKDDIMEHLTDNNRKETQYLILKSQKWILSQNVEIVKNFYTYV